MSVTQKIAALWIVVLFNMAFADILSFISPGFVAQVSTGAIDGITITPMFLLIAAVFIQIPIAMMFLTRVLRPRVNRLCNLVAVVLTVLFVVGGGSLMPHYIFMASIEVIALIYIAVLAWGMRSDA
jgi:hypothetical protein